MAQIKRRVECYAGGKADERPVRLRLDERDYMVEEIVDQWYGSDDAFFKVRTDIATFISSDAICPLMSGTWSLSVW